MLIQLNQEFWSQQERRQFQETRRQTKGGQLCIWELALALPHRHPAAEIISTHIRTHKCLARIKAEKKTPIEYTLPKKG